MKQPQSHGSLLTFVLALFASKRGEMMPFVLTCTAQAVHISPFVVSCPSTQRKTWRDASQKPSCCSAQGAGQ